MKKFVIIGAVVAIVFIGAVTTFVIFSSSKRAVAPGDTRTSTQSFNAVEACDVLTEEIASEVLGGEVQKSTMPAVQTDDLSSSTCSYTKSTDGVGLLVRSAKNQIGADSNKSLFSSSLPDNSEKVTGIGDQAFYSKENGQLNILKGNNWYIITAYKSRVANTSIEANKAVAQKLKFE